MGGRGRKKELPLQTEQTFAHRRSHARSEKKGAFAKKKDFPEGVASVYRETNLIYDERENFFFSLFFKSVADKSPLTTAVAKIGFCRRGRSIFYL